jgi:OmcA/MtrC family decaheme c-type cytochrome
VYAVSQDGVAAPADFNGTAQSYLRSLWNGAATGATAGTLSGPDADGYYTATITGAVIPDDAVMLTGGLGFSYNVKTTLPLTQTNLDDYPVVASTAAGLTAGMPNKTGGLIVIVPNESKVASLGCGSTAPGACTATGAYVGRRPIVEDKRCNACHQELGTFTEDAFHAGQRNDGTTCSWCHNPNRASSGWSADSASFVHAIHGGAKRTVPFNWHATSATENFSGVKYPGILGQCETCHVPGSYDFSSTASVAAVPNRLFRTVATGTIAASISTPPTGFGSTGAPGATPGFVPGTVYGAGPSVASATGIVTPGADTTLVNSPIATACLSCHDGNATPFPVADHIKGEGGSVYEARSTALPKQERCLICHGPTGDASIKAKHAK